MFYFLLFVAMPLLIISVGLGWWATKQDFRVANRVLIGQLMIDSAIIAFFILFFFENLNIVLISGALIYAGITSVRLRTLFDRLDQFMD
ncbi:MAG: hypothetical protein LAT67_00165 [Balneolales bacterium]|nr:hypothetical protein [Balneolales bacterium]